MEVNLVLLLEHIAQNTGESPEEVRSKVSVEYWKSRCDFGTLYGIDLFEKYLTARDISILEKIGDGFGIKIPLSEIQETSFPREKVTLLVSGTYLNHFIRKYKDKFEFNE